VRNFCTRWGWFLIAGVVLASFAVYPGDEVLLASRIFMGVGFLVAALAFYMRGRSGPQ